MTPGASNRRGALDAERLLADTRWLKRLARGLVADDNSADDLAQDAWLAALKARSSGTVALGAVESERSWLTGVLHNLAWKQRRSHARRSSREQRGAREEALPSTGALVARAEMQRAISDAVVALDEPMRTTILLRYIEELSSAEIARRQGIPEGTVRWRVKRGLEMLREELEERRGNEWLHGCALVAGLVRAPEALIATGAASASAGAASTGGATAGAIAGGLGLKAAGALAAGLALTGGGLAVNAHWNELDSGSTLVANTSIETASGSGAPSIASTTSARARTAGTDDEPSIADEAGGAGATRIRIPLAVRSDAPEGGSASASTPSTSDGASHASVRIDRDVRSSSRHQPSGEYVCEGEPLDLTEVPWAMYALRIDVEGDENDLDVVSSGPLPIDGPFAAYFDGAFDFDELATESASRAGEGADLALPLSDGTREIETRVTWHGNGPPVAGQRAKVVVLPAGANHAAKTSALLRAVRGSAPQNAPLPAPLPASGPTEPR